MISNNLFERLAAALCSTLMQSLWQGLVLAAIAGLVVICTRKRSPALRYNLLIGALLVFAVSVSVTFGWRLQKEAGVVGSRAVAKPARVVVLPMADYPALQPATARQTGTTGLINEYLNRHHNTIVLAWFLVICARSLHLGVGVFGTYRLRRVRVSPVEDRWRERMRRLADELGIKQKVALLESGLAKAPMMIGHLKPVVLVPIGLLTALSPEEVEAVLIHELAHIRRRDYLVNMLQSLMEIVFFFNPAVLWVSKLIRTERENCCDDLAVAHNNNKAGYIRALVSCEQYQSSVPAYAMAFPGSQHTLLHRVTRMVSNQNHSLNLFEKTALAVCLVGAGLFMMAFSAKKDIHPAPPPIFVHGAQQPPVQPKVGSEPAPRHQAAPKGSNVRPQHVVVRGNAPGRGNVPGPKTDSVPPVPKGETAGDTSYPASAQRYVALHRDYRDQSAQYQDQSARYQDHSNRYRDQSARYASDEARAKIDLMRDGLVTDTNHLHFYINEKGFILNGVPQSPEVFQRYKNKYDPNDTPGWSWGHGTERPPLKN